MADNTNQPEDLAARNLATGAGLPRVGEAGPALDDRAGRRDAAGADRIEATAQDAARDAAEAGADLRDRVAGAAGSAHQRADEALDAAQDQAADAYDDVRSWASDRYDAQSRRVSALAERGSRRLREGRSATEAFVADNPLLVGIVGLAAGLLLGALLPRTRREDEAIGPYADEARGRGLRYAREMTQRGRAFVETALDTDNLDAAMRRAGAGPDEEAAHREGTMGREHRL